MGTPAQKRYSYAFDRIEIAISAEYYLEAIAIEESIISDRLDSFLLKNGYAKPVELRHAFNRAEGEKNYSSLASKITKCSKVASTKQTEWASFETLSKRLQNWRKGRNSALHGIVKVTLEYEESGENETLEKVLAKSKKIATTGKDLAEEVHQWRRSQAARKGHRTRSEKKTKTKGK